MYRSSALIDQGTGAALKLPLSGAIIAGDDGVITCYRFDLRLNLLIDNFSINLTVYLCIYIYVYCS